MKKFVRLALFMALLGATIFIGYRSVEANNGGVIKNIDYQYEQEGKPKFEYGFISIEDPDNPGHGITILDRDLGAMSVADVGYYYQWGNNYGFDEDGCRDINGRIFEKCSDDVTQNSVNASTDGAIWSNEYDAKGYYGNVFIKSDEGHGYDYWTDSTNNSSNHENLRGGAGDYDNNWGYDADNYVATNVTGRRGPCPDGTHVPSQGEWEALLRMWIARNGEGSYYLYNHGGELYLEDYDGGNAVIFDFMDDLEMIFGLTYSRGSSDAFLYPNVGESTWRSSSSRSDSSSRSQGIVMSNGEIVTRGIHRAGGYPVRCFANEYKAPAPAVVEVTVKFEANGGTAVGSQIVESGSVLTEPSAPTKDHSMFTGWYMDNMLTQRFDFSTPISGDMTLYAKWDCEEGYYPLNNGQMCFTYETISIEDPNNPGHGITILDRNIGATTTGAGPLADEDSYGYYYQWGNNYGFPTTGDINNITNEPIDASLYRPSEYYSDILIQNINNIDYFLLESDAENMWGGGGDAVSGNMGYDADIYLATNLKDRQGPCPVGTHVPSQGEWNAFIRMWWATNSGNYEEGTYDWIDDARLLSYLYDHEEDRISKDFYDLFQIPFAGRRLYKDATLLHTGINATLWSSSPYYSNLSGYVRSIHVKSDYLYPSSYHIDGIGLSVRCFANEYKGVAPAAVEVTVTFNTNGGTAVDSQTVDSGSVAIEPSAPTKTGFVFDGWYEDSTLHGNKFDFSTPITGDITLYAKFVIKEYDIKFVEDNGRVLSIKKYPHGTNAQSIIIPTPTKTEDSDYRYTFLGWSPAITDVTGHVTYTATYASEKKGGGRSGGGGRGGGGGGENPSDPVPSDPQHPSADDSGDKPENKPENKPEEKPTNPVPSSPKGGDKPSEKPYKPETIDAYKRAYANNFTQYANINEARLSDPLNRSEMAKITSIFATQFLDKIPDESKQKICSKYSDMRKVDNEMKYFITQSCELGYMGYQSNGVDLLARFRPYTSVTVAEASTVLSRIMRGREYAMNGKDWYKGHLYAVYNYALIDDIRKPNSHITREQAFLMLYRLVDKLKN